MTAPHPTPNPTLPWQVGVRVQVQHSRRSAPGRIISIHRVNGGIEYVIRTDPTDGGIGQVLNIWTASGRSSFLSAPNPAFKASTQ